MRRLLLLLAVPLLIGTAVGVANWRVDPFGWFYDGSTFWANDPSTDVDVRGTQYNAY